MRKMREAILSDNFLEWREKFLKDYHSDESEVEKLPSCQMRSIHPNPPI